MRKPETAPSYSSVQGRRSYSGVSATREVPSGQSITYGVLHSRTFVVLTRQIDVHKQMKPERPARPHDLYNAIRSCIRILNEEVVNPSSCLLIEKYLPALAYLGVLPPGLDAWTDTSTMVF